MEEESGWFWAGYKRDKFLHGVYSLQSSNFIIFSDDSLFVDDSNSDMTRTCLYREKGALKLTFCKEFRTKPFICQADAVKRERCDKTDTVPRFSELIPEAISSDHKQAFYALNSCQDKQGKEWKHRDGYDMFWSWSALERAADATQPGVDHNGGYIVKLETRCEKVVRKMGGDGFTADITSCPSDPLHLCKTSLFVSDRWVKHVDALKYCTFYSCQLMTKAEIEANKPFLSSMTCPKTLTAYANNERTDVGKYQFSVKS